MHEPRLVDQRLDRRLVGLRPAQLHQLRRRRLQERTAWPASATMRRRALRRRGDWDDAARRLGYRVDPSPRSAPSGRPTTAASATSPGERHRPGHGDHRGVLRRDLPAATAAVRSRSATSATSTSTTSPRPRSSGRTVRSSRSPTASRVLDPRVDDRGPPLAGPAAGPTVGPRGAVLVRGGAALARDGSGSRGGRDHPRRPGPRRHRPTTERRSPRDVGASAANASPRSPCRAPDDRCWPTTSPTGALVSPPLHRGGSLDAPPGSARPGTWPRTPLPCWVRALTAGRCWSRSRPWARRRPDPGGVASRLGAGLRRRRPRR